MPRHAEYDRDTVIAEATAVFWERGYTQTSIGDLVSATRLQPGSLYAAFGNKKQLTSDEKQELLEVIDQYNRDFIGKIRRLRMDSSPALPKIRKLLQQIVDEAAEGKAENGCLTVNALLEMSQHDADIADRLHAYNAKLRKAFAWLVKDAQSEGDVVAGQDPNELAAFVMGMRVMCKSRPDRASLEAIVTGVLAALQSGQD